MGHLTDVVGLGYSDLVQRFRINRSGLYLLHPLPLRSFRFRFREC